MIIREMFPDDTVVQKVVQKSFEGILSYTKSKVFPVDATSRILQQEVISQKGATEEGLVNEVHDWERVLLKPGLRFS